MKKIFKYLSILYLIFLSIIFLMPLDFYLITESLTTEQHPSNSTSFLIHFILFFILYSFMYFSFINKLNIFIFCLIYSFLIEFLQQFSSRGFQISDIIFNLLGFLTAFLLILFFMQSLKTKKM